MALFELVICSGLKVAYDLWQLCGFWGSITSGGEGGLGSYKSQTEVLEHTQLNLDTPLPSPPPHPRNF